MYNEQLSDRILDILLEAFPQKLMLNQLQEKLPEFHAVPEADWLTSLEALNADGMVGGSFLRSGYQHALQSVGLLFVTPKARQQFLARRPPLQDQQVSRRPPKVAELSFTTAFERFTARRVVGNGGAGTVYEVLDENGNPFALKVLNQTADSLKIKRFKNEISFCSRNVHPNIIRVIDHGAFTSGEKSVPFYVMPLYPVTLRKIMASNSMNGVDRMKLFGRILDGVEAAHLQGVVHRDLKPENILLNPSDDTLVIADFGIARFKEEDLYTAVETQKHDRLANFLYSAPEQRERGREVDLRADLFALGLMLNEIFTAQVPQGAGYRRINESCPEMGHLDPLVDELIQQDAAKRPNSVASIKLQLLARGQDSIRLQELNRLKTAVLPETELDDPSIANPISLVALDYGDGMLKLKLSQVPSTPWIHTFKNLPNFAAVFGKGPSKFIFQADEATIPATEADAQILINHFKNYVTDTNRLHKIEAEAARRREIEARNRELRDSVERIERERRVRDTILKNTKV